MYVAALLHYVAYITVCKLWAKNLHFFISLCLYKGDPNPNLCNIYLSSSILS